MSAAATVPCPRPKPSCPVGIFACLEGHRLPTPLLQGPEGAPKAHGHWTGCEQGVRGHRAAQEAARCGHDLLGEVVALPAPSFYLAVGSVAFSPSSTRENTSSCAALSFAVGPQPLARLGGGTMQTWVSPFITALLCVKVEGAGEGPRSGLQQGHAGLHRKICTLIFYSSKAEVVGMKENSLWSFTTRVNEFLGLL